MKSRKKRARAGSGERERGGRGDGGRGKRVAEAGMKNARGGYAGDAIAMPFANINFSKLIKGAISLLSTIPPSPLLPSFRHPFAPAKRHCRITTGGEKARAGLNNISIYLPLCTCWPSCCWRPAWRTRERNWRSRGYRDPRGIRPASASRLLVPRNVCYTLPPGRSRRVCVCVIKTTQHLRAIPPREHSLVPLR